MSRLQEVVDKATGLRSPDDIMEEILVALTDTKRILPEIGKYYTFVYLAKTPGIEYDEFPLIACMELERWGIKGFNYHWGKMRNYTWEEVIGEFYEVLPIEVNDARNLKYAKFKLNT